MKKRGENVKVMLEAQVMDLQPDVRKAGYYRMNMYQEGENNLIKISSVPQTEVPKLKPGEKVVIMIDNFIFRPSDGGAFPVNKFIALA